ncbi:TatD family hydrolase [uncultured Ferrimonas sp.]|uniref:TatD family hydrolase n=1 Tax=uncultured Ferrimonas sp. TaxID=432640 RepID=UPI00262F9FCD|nr:TatD family hydrolase [uncultured Ferrimonas sp.]
MIDSHCHLDLPPLLGQLDAVLARAAAAGITQMLVPAVNRERWPQLEQLAQRPQLQVAIGLHPCFAHNVSDDLQRMAERLRCSHPFIAIGECGLDAVAGQLPMSQQLLLCQAQLTLAQQHQLPVILHVRSAHNEMLQLLSRTKLLAGGVVHGFSGSIELATQYIRHNLHLGIGGVCTYPRAKKTRAMVAQLPREWMLFETDSPDMPLSGHQGQPNQPHQIANIVREVATIRGEPIDYLHAIQQENYRRLFHIEHF